MKRTLFVSADMEGVAGVSAPSQLVPEGFGYDRARLLFTDELVAVCQSAHENAIERVIIGDSHGTGLNIAIDRLPPYAELIVCWPRPLGMMQGVEEEGVVAAFFVGYHAGGTDHDGNLAHTLNGAAFRQIRLNGEPSSEARLNAAIAGWAGVPVALISGDESFVKSSTAFIPDAEQVVSKTSYGYLASRSITPEVNRAALARATAQAIKRADELALFTLKAPIEIEIDFNYRLPAELLSYLPVVERISSHSVRYYAADMEAASRFLEFASGYASTRRS